MGGIWAKKRRWYKAGGFLFGNDERTLLVYYIFIASRKAREFLGICGVLQ
jgi:hypothetical protein